MRPAQCISRPSCWDIHIVACSHKKTHECLLSVFSNTAQHVKGVTRHSTGTAGCTMHRHSNTKTLTPNRNSLTHRTKWHAKEHNAPRTANAQHRHTRTYTHVYMPMHLHTNTQIHHSTYDFSHTTPDLTRPSENCQFVHQKRWKLCPLIAGTRV